MSQDGDAWDEARATALALRLLSRREHTRLELDEKLRRRGVPDAVRRTVLLKVTAWNALDDRRMADEYVRVRRRNKGRHALLRELEVRGVDDVDREAAVADLTDDDQRRAATDLLERQRWRFATADARKNVAKASAFLVRRGFDHDVVRDVIEASGLIESGVVVDDQDVAGDDDPSSP